MVPKNKNSRYFEIEALRFRFATLSHYQRNLYGQYFGILPASDLLDFKNMISLNINQASRS